MIKILHTADWHLGKRLHQRERLAEQRAVLEEIHQIAEAEAVDLILVAGDLFDAINPPNDAIELFYHALKKLGKNGERPVIAIAGNHDSPDRIEAPDPLARECGIVLAGYPNTEVPPFALDSGFEVLQSEPGFLEVRLPGPDASVRLLLTPYANEHRLQRFLGEEEDEGMRAALQRQWAELAGRHCDEEGVNLLVAHLFMVKKGEKVPEEPEGEKPIRVGTASLVYPELVPSQIQYAALGHLHRSQTLQQGNTHIAYSGSPLCYSFSESGQKKYVHLVEGGPGEKMKVRRRELRAGRPVLKAVFQDVARALAWLEDHAEAYTEITLQTDTFLKAGEIKQLQEASPFLLNIIPEPQGVQEELEQQARIDLSRPLEALFADYFVWKTGQQPGEEIITLLQEARQRKPR